MAPDPVDDPGDRDLLAGEYVLGTLTGPERQGVEARLPRDEELADLVAAWQRRLTPLALALPPVEPPPQLWWNISRSIGRAGAAPRRVARVPRRRRVGAGGGFWRAWALGSSLVAAFLALSIALRSPAPPPPAPAPRLIAVLLDAEAKPALLVSTTPNASRVRARPLAAPPGDSHALELWLLPPVGSPVSLGVMQEGAVAARPFDPASSQFLTPGAGVAASLEPRGGSATGQPTGPVLYQGVLIRDD